MKSKDIKVGQYYARVKRRANRRYSSAEICDRVQVVGNPGEWYLDKGARFYNESNYKKVNGNKHVYDRVKGQVLVRLLDDNGKPLTYFNGKEERRELVNLSQIKCEWIAHVAEEKERDAARKKNADRDEKAREAKLDRFQKVQSRLKSDFGIEMSDHGINRYNCSERVDISLADLEKVLGINGDA